MLQFVAHGSYAAAAAADAANVCVCQKHTLVVKLLQSSFELRMRSDKSRLFRSVFVLPLCGPLI
jgi:hypothetical protein